MSRGPRDPVAWLRPWSRPPAGCSDWPRASRAQCKLERCCSRSDPAARLGRTAFPWARPRYGARLAPSPSREIDWPSRFGEREEHSLYKEFTLQKERVKLCGTKSTERQSSHYWFLSRRGWSLCIAISPSPPHSLLVKAPVGEPASPSCSQSRPCSWTSAMLPQGLGAPGESGPFVSAAFRPEVWMEDATQTRTSPNPACALP